MSIRMNCPAKERKPEMRAPVSAASPFGVNNAAPGAGDCAIGLSCRAANSARRHCAAPGFNRSEEHTSELQSLMRISYAVFCLKQKEYTLSRHTQIHERTKTHE